MEIKNEQSGRSLLEALLYVSFLILIGASITQLVSEAFDRYAIGRTSQQVLELKKTVMQFTAANEDYTVLACSDCDTSINYDDLYDINKDNGLNKIFKDKSLPYELNHRSHSLGGKFSIGCASDIAEDKGDIENNYMFFIAFKGLKQEACIEILSRGQFYTEGSEADTILVNPEYSDGYAWQFKHSLFQTQRHIRKEIITHRLTLDEGILCCTRKLDNTIIWIYS